ncbi:MAG: phosphopantothenate/pantothenate synthetase [Methanobacteriota archaeon]
MDVPDTHPRAKSLRTREALAKGVEDGLTHVTGLIAHGRGEAFDYLLGEATSAAALPSIRAAAAALKTAKRPVVSVNGNVAVLCPDAVRDLADAAGAKVEVNVFHRTPGRVERIVRHLEGHGMTALGARPDARIPGLDHARALCTTEGIFSADVVLVPLEDGDRCAALRAMGKIVCVVDLNPLSRSAQAASVTIVDEVTRALPLVTDEARSQDAATARKVLSEYDNARALREALLFMRGRLQALAEESG